MTTVSRSTTSNAQPATQTEMREVAKAAKIFNHADLATLTGHGVVKVTGTVTYRVKDAKIVVATARASYDDLWGGKGKGKLEVTINIKTGKAKGTLE